MAVAPEVIAAGAGAGETAAGAGAGEAGVWRAASRASGGLRAAPAQAAGAVRGGYQRVSSPSAAAQTVTKLVWAAALGLIVLEIAAEATGQRWSFSLPTSGRPLQPQGYAPLYAGQAQAGASMPWVPLTVVNPSPGQVTTPGATVSGGALLQP